MSQAVDDLSGVGRTIRVALGERDQIDNALQNQAGDFYRALMQPGVLHQLGKYQLRQLKDTLRDFNANTGVWRSK